ncbi:MAG: flagellar biosynthetic protein FliO [Candidatus Hydrogenedentes bacterium]|nr:flagellar biosynthetic protein FliO [Candidatus Hydrogenedentota bacterium]
MNSRALRCLACLAFVLHLPLDAQEDKTGLRKIDAPPMQELGLAVTAQETSPENTASSAAPPVPAEAGAALPEPQPATEEAPQNPPPDPVMQRIQAELDQDAAGAQGEATASGRAPGAGGSQEIFGKYALRALAGLSFVIALILLLQYLLRRFAQNTPLLAGMRLGAVIGKVYLNPKASLHYVKSGGRILVLGVTPNQITFISDFDESAFAAPELGAPAVSPADTISFVEALRAQTQQLTAATLPAPDDDLASLRGDIQRLQQYLQEETHGKKR